MCSVHNGKLTLREYSDYEIEGDHFFWMTMDRGHRNRACGFQYLDNLVFQNVRRICFYIYLFSDSWVPYGLDYSGLSLWLGKHVNNHILCISSLRQYASLSCDYTLPHTLQFCSHTDHTVQPHHSVILILFFGGNSSWTMKLLCPSSQVLPVLFPKIHQLSNLGWDGGWDSSNFLSDPGKPGVRSLGPLVTE